MLMCICSRVEDALEAAGIRYDRLDGTMKRDERTRAMDNLKYDPGCEVLLVSLKAGGVGLNLTAAQRVYLMDPYWNPAVENQAVDRIVSLFCALFVGKLLNLSLSASSGSNETGHHRQINNREYHRSASFGSPEKEDRAGQHDARATP